MIDITLLVNGVLVIALFATLFYMASTLGQIKAELISISHHLRKQGMHKGDQGKNDDPETDNPDEGA